MVEYSSKYSWKLDAPKILPQMHQSSAIPKLSVLLVCSISNQRVTEKLKFGLHQNKIRPSTWSRTHWLRVMEQLREMFCLFWWMLLRFHCCKGHCRGPVPPLIQLSNREMNSYDTEHLCAPEPNLVLPYSRDYTGVTRGCLSFPPPKTRQERLSSSNPAT